MSFLARSPQEVCYRNRIDALTPRLVHFNPSNKRHAEDVGVENSKRTYKLEKLASEFNMNADSTNME